MGLLLLFASCKQDNQLTHTVQQEDVRQLNDALATVEVVHPSFRSFQSATEITGTVKPDQQVMLHAMAEGYLSSINVDIGDRVSKGQIIATLENPILTYESQNATVKIKEAEAGILQAKAELKMAQVEEKTKRVIYENIKSVYDQSKGLTTITELQNAKGAAELAAATLEAKQAQIDVQMAILDANISGKGAVDERGGMLKIKAPFSGVITGRYVDAGTMIQNALVNSNVPPIVSIESTNPVRLSIPIPESDVAGISKGDEVKVSFPTLGGADISAKVSRLSRSLDQASKTMEVQIDLQNKDGKIKPGMYAKVTMGLKARSNILSLPNEAVVIKKDAPWVYAVNGNIVEEISLKKGLSGKEYFEVLNSAFTEKTQIITKGKSLVRAGQEVNAILKKD